MFNDAVGSTFAVGGSSTFDRVLDTDVDKCDIGNERDDHDDCDHDDDIRNRDVVDNIDRTAHLDFNE